MHSSQSIYRGYAIYVADLGPSWSFRAEPINPDLPILTRSKFDGHDSQGTALKAAKRQIDQLFAD